jgi:hypothetical protein
MRDRALREPYGYLRLDDRSHFPSLKVILPTPALSPSTATWWYV